MGIKAEVHCQVYFKIDDRLHRGEFVRETELVSPPGADDILWGLMTNVPAKFDGPLDKKACDYCILIHNVIHDVERDRLVLWTMPFSQKQNLSNILQLLAGGEGSYVVLDEEWVAMHFSKTAWRRVSVADCKKEQDQCESSHDEPGE